MEAQIWVNIGSGIGLFSDGIKPSPGPSSSSLSSSSSSSSPSSSLLSSSLWPLYIYINFTAYLTIIMFRLILLYKRNLVMKAANRNGLKPRRPQTETTTIRNARNRKGHKPKRSQTENATDRNGHKPKRPQIEWTQIIWHKFCRNLKSCWLFGQFCIRFCQLYSYFLVYMYGIMEHCLLFPNWVSWSFDVTFI